MSANKTHIQIHRFHDAVALYVGTGETAYISPRDARRVARALYVASKDIDRRKFTESSCGTFELDARDPRRD